MATFKIKRNVKTGTYPILEIFSGIENSRPLKKLFGKRLGTVLKDLKIQIKRHKWGYCWIDDKKGQIVMNINYLKKGKKTDLYLDVVHELVHIKQWALGKELWDKRYAYVDRPTEIEAYRVAAQEAKRIGLTKSQILKYLYVEWATPEENKKLAKTIGLYIPKF